MKFHTPDSGRFIDLLKHNSEAFPDLSGLSINKSSKGYDYVTLNWLQYYSLVVKISSYLLKKLNIDSASKRLTIAVLSNPSTDYFFYTLSFMQLNIVPLHLSTRISDDSCIHLLEKGNVAGILVSEEFYKRGLRLQSKMGHHVDVFKMDRLNYSKIMDIELNSTELVKVNDYISFLNQGDELSYYLHSTGSTSIHPKLIPITNNVLFGQTSRALNDSPEYPRKQSMLAPLPLYHTAGQMFNLHRAIRWCQHIIAPPSLEGLVLNGAMVLDLMDYIHFDIINWLPKLMIELIDYCNSIPHGEGWNKLIKWGGSHEVGGAPLPQEYMDQFLSNEQKLRFFYGATEFGIFGYTEIVSKLGGCSKFRFSDHSQYYMSLYDKSEGIYELIIKKEELGLFNRVKDYKTKDLFKNISWNPLIAGEYHSRCDDILVHITGEKTNPIPMEDLLNQCSVVARSVILGKNHTLNHCLIQLDWSKVGLIDFTTAMKLVREQLKLVNDMSPSHSRLLEDCIHILDRDQEIMVTVKGNVIRQVNYNLYKHLVEDTKVFGLLTPAEPDSAFLMVTEIVSEALNLSEKIDSDENFFKLGMDSLSALIIVKKLQHSFPTIAFNVSQIYKLKTVNNIVNYMDQKFVIEEVTVPKIQHKIDSMLNKYFSKFTDYISVEYNRRVGKRSVLVVGSNGALACHYILALLHRDDIDRVIGLVRGTQFEDITSYQVSIMKQKGLFIHQRVLHKLQCFSANMLQPNFNLPESVYQDIFDSTTEVTQVGWRMNFLNSLEDFEDCIETTSNLLEFCLQNTKNPKVFNFISTIAPTVPTYKPEYNGVIPETPTSGKVTNLNSCTGYGLSKLVGEQICYQIAKTKNLPVNVFRVGELSGDQSLGQWNIKEFLPLLIRTIVKLKVYPNLSSKSISWVPIDLAAKSLADLGHFKAQNPELYTIVNPHKSEWKVVLDYIQTQINVELQEVDLSEFLNLLKSTSSDISEVDISQGLSDFLEDYLKDDGNIKIIWDVCKTCEQTEYLANCPPIDSNLIRKYFNYWIQLRYFD